MIISISGPGRSGKSSIVDLLRDSMPKSTVFISDLYREVWEDLVKRGLFSKFTEVIKDKDYLLMYVCHVMDAYEKILKEYYDYDGIVVLECCYLDYLIYLQLNTWFHYPSSEFEQTRIVKLLKDKEMISRIYLTTADDSSFPIGADDFEVKSSKYTFRKNRNLELSFYDIYRDNVNVVNLPPNTYVCDKIILDDLINEGYIQSTQ